MVNASAGIPSGKVTVIDLTVGDGLTDEVVANVDMFGTRMKSGGFGKGQGSMVVTIDWNRTDV